MIGLALFLAAALFFAGNSAQPVIFDDNEGLYAGAVREMVQRGDWLIPTNDGLPRIQKPPLTYWAMIVSVRMFGMNEFAIRLPNALFTAAWVYVTFLIGLRLRDVRFGVMAASIHATMLGVFVFTHLVQPEPFLGASISLALYAVVSALLDPPKIVFWARLAWVAMALGSLAKGLHAALWPLGVIAVAMLLFPRYRAVLKGFFHWSGPVIFLALTVPWYLYMELKLPGFLSAHFFREQISAAVDSHFDRETLAIPIWMFYLQHLIFFAPWVLFAPAAAWAWSQERKDRVEASIWAVIWLWAAVTFGTVTFSNLQDYYAMTCWGVAALWLAAAFHSNRSPRWMLIAPCAILVTAGVGLLVFAFGFKDILLHGSDQIAPIAERDTFANALSGISLGVWQSFLPLMKTAGVTLLLGGGLATWFFVRKKSDANYAVAALTLSMVVLCSLATAGFAIMGPNFSLVEAARAINASAKPDALVVCEGAPHQSSSLLFYLNRRIHWIHAPSQREFAVRVLGKGRELYLDDEQLQALWKSGRQVFLIVEDERLDAWQKRLETVNLLARNGTRRVLVNQ